MSGNGTKLDDMVAGAKAREATLADTIKGAKALVEQLNSTKNSSEGTMNNAVAIFDKYM